MLEETWGVAVRLFALWELMLRVELVGFKAGIPGGGWSDGKCRMEYNEVPEVTMLLSKGNSLLWNWELAGECRDRISLLKFPPLEASINRVVIAEAALDTEDMSHAFEVLLGCGWREDEGLGGMPTGRISITLETLLWQIGHTVTTREHAVQQHICEQAKSTCIKQSTQPYLSTMSTNCVTCAINKLGQNIKSFSSSNVH